jgi:hypothetical protein
MSRARQTFRQRDITKALKGAFASGATNVRVEVDRDGRIVILADKAQAIQGAAHSENEWDTV